MDQLADESQPALIAISLSQPKASYMPVAGEALLAAVTGALAFPFVVAPLSPKPILDFLPRELLAFVALALLFRVVCLPTSLRRRMLLLFFAGCVHFSLLLYWLDIALVRFGGMSRWYAVPALSILVGYCACYWAALAALVDLLQKRLKLPTSLTFALAVVFLEWLRSHLLTGFPCGIWGYSQARNLLLIQLASIGGVYLVSFVVAVGAGLAAQVATRRPPFRHHLVWLCIVVIGAHLMGLGLLMASKPDEGEGLIAAVLQGNIDQTTKNQDRFVRQSILQKYFELDQEARKIEPDLIVWPEASWPGRLPIDMRVLPGFKPGSATLVGATTETYKKHQRTSHNSAFFVDSKGFIADRYDKRHLVPFGEYVPWSTFLPLEPIVPGIPDVSPGLTARPIGTPPLGVLICYDGVFPELGRQSVNAGAELLVNMTNDGWYGVSSAPYLHRDYYVLRAVETDRWLIRAANTGISGFISPQGQILNRTTMNERTMTHARVWTRKTTTFYSRFGDWLPAITIGIFLGILAQYFKRRA